MKFSGIARKVDDLGRVVLPVEIRRALGLSAGDEVDIALEETTILLRKIEARCTFCGATEGLRGFRGRQVCASCASELGSTDSA
jgi:transcriptional pleiotropic regulator of transition state genes